MTTISDEQKDLVKAIVCEILEIEPDEISETSRFIEDHDADSLRAIEILARLEITLGITIDQAELARMTNLANVYTVVAETKTRV